MIVVVATIEDVTDAGAKLLDACYDFLKKNYPGTRLERLTSMSGRQGIRFAVWWHASLGAKEAYDAKLNADPGWLKLLKDAGPGTLWTQRDDYYNVVE
jgi:hypothetical protein